VQHAFGEPASAVTAGCQGVRTDAQQHPLGGVEQLRAGVLDVTPVGRANSIQWRPPIKVGAAHRSHARRAESFGVDAARYDRNRPHYRTP